MQKWCRTCVSCAKRKISAPKQHAALQSVQVGSPLQMVACDILGPLPTTATGNTYVLVIGDNFTRWMEAFAIPNQEAPTIAQKLVNEFFCRFSMPEQLHSDQGRQFESILIVEICKILHIHKTRTTPYHPQGDGMVERFNCTLVNMLISSISDLENDSWLEYLPKVCL